MPRVGFDADVRCEGGLFGRIGTMLLKLWIQWFGMEHEILFAKVRKSIRMKADKTNLN